MDYFTLNKKNWHNSLNNLIKKITFLLLLTFVNTNFSAQTIEKQGFFDFCYVYKKI